LQNLCIVWRKNIVWRRKVQITNVLWKIGKLLLIFGTWLSYKRWEDIV
jgi:hypothetical protein